MKLGTAPRSDSSPLLFSVSRAMTPVFLCILPCLPDSAQSSMCASCAGHATLVSLIHLLSPSIFLLALLYMRWVPFSAIRLRALLPLFCHLGSIALIPLPHLPPGSPAVLLASGRATPTSSLPRPRRPSLRPTFTSDSATCTVNPSLHLSDPRIGSPSSMRPCMLMLKGRPVLNRARHGYLAPMHLKRHMHWHLPRVMTQLLSSPHSAPQ